MIVSELKLYNFRKFKSNDNEPGLSITFHKGLNALIGENDSGKTAVIDAIKLVLLTQSNEYIRPTDEDFFIDSDGQSVTEFGVKIVREVFGTLTADRVNKAVIVSTSSFSREARKFAGDQNSMIELVDLNDLLRMIRK